MDAASRDRTLAPSTVALALADAERRGFRLAVIGRACALSAIAAFYLIVFPWPNNLPMAGVFLAFAAAGLVPLALIGSRLERPARFALFAVDVVAIAAMLAFGPLSTGDDIPQNLIFLSSRHVYFFVLVALSLLTLSPALVLWTGFLGVSGLAAATAAIMAGMERVVSFSDLPRGPTREQFMAVVASPDFLNLPVRVNEGMVLALVTALAALAVHRARAMTRAHAAVEEKRSRLQRLFGRYVPVQVAEQLAEAGRLAPEMREASVLFADIEGFTGIAEQLPPAEVIGLLNGFFGATTDIIDRHNGVVVNHVGDALIAAFNAPLMVADFAGRAVAAAGALQALVAARDFDGHRLRVRIGIATGPVAAGTVGGAERQTYTLYGDTVNLAQRLERLNKELGTDCLVCGRTYSEAKRGGIDARPVGQTQVRGRGEPVEVFSIVRQAAASNLN